MPEKLRVADTVATKVQSIPVPKCSNFQSTLFGTAEFYAIYELREKNRITDEIIEIKVFLRGLGPRIRTHL